jgi:hypothetical protein
MTRFFQHRDTEDTEVTGNGSVSVASVLSVPLCLIGCP